MVGSSWVQNELKVCETISVFYRQNIFQKPATYAFKTLSLNPQI